MGYMGGYGNTLSGFIGSLLIFFVKLLMVVLIVALFAGIIVWIKNTFFKDGNFKESLKDGGKKISQSQVVQTINNDPILKMISVVLLVIVGVVLLFSLFSGFNSGGMGYGMNGYMNGYSMNGYMNRMGGDGFGGFVNVGFGPNATYGISGLLMIIAQLLMWVLFISLIIAALVYIKNQYESGKLNLWKNKPQDSNQNPPIIDVQPTNTQ